MLAQWLIETWFGYLEYLFLLLKKYKKNWCHYGLPRGDIYSQICRLFVYIFNIIINFEIKFKYWWGKVAKLVRIVLTIQSDEWIKSERKRLTGVTNNKSDQFYWKNTSRSNQTLINETTEIDSDWHRDQSLVTHTRDLSVVSFIWNLFSYYAVYIILCVFQVLSGNAG